MLIKITTIALLAAMLTGCTGTLTSPAASIPQALTTSDTLLLILDLPAEPTSTNTGPRSYSPSISNQRKAAQITKDHELRVLWQWPMPSIEAYCIVIDQPSDSTAVAIEKDSRVRWVQNNQQFHLQKGNHPKNRDYPKNQSFSQVLSNTAGSGLGIKIAVIDTGLDANHPSLVGSKISTHNFVGNQDTTPIEQHGTAVAGLIVAQPSAHSPVAGIAPDAMLHSLRACWQTANEPGVCNSLSLSLALEAAIALRPDLINLSLSGPRDRLLEAQLRALLRQGSMVVAAYDENRMLNNRFPPPKNGVIYARSEPNSNDKKSFSKSPDEMQVVRAPGEALTLTPHASYDVITGHSIATPQITALAARMAEQQPALPVEQLISHLKQQLKSRQLAQSTPF